MIVTDRYAICTVQLYMMYNYIMLLISICRALQDECSRNSQTTLNSKDKSKASSVSRIEHRALVHHSAAAISGGSSGNIPEPVATVESSEQLLQRPEGINTQGTR